MSNLAIEIFNAKVAKLEEELAPHAEERCQCHLNGNCSCTEDPIGTFTKIGYHCTLDFVLSCELENLLRS